MELVQRLTQQVDSKHEHEYRKSTFNCLSVNSFVSSAFHSNISAAPPASPVPSASGFPTSS